tara:strand:+ start:2932 stop:5397 length:2466 start_codon:yes stop_codon:yes gene_type:complete
MTRPDVLIASLLLIVASLSGCITEELVDDILGCMDENAANYEENATTELVGDCIYMATAETFMEAMTDVGSIEDILEDTPKAGYSQSISSSEWNQDVGMQMDVEIEDIVMADLNTDSVYVHNSISIAGLLQMEYTHVQVGEVVNIHLLMGGMMAQGDATQSVSQTRDATPNVLEVIAEQAGLFTGEDDDGEDDDGPVVSDGLPEDAVITITMSDDMESQTMKMEYTEDGAEITTTVHIDQNQDLVSMSVESDNGSASSSMTYEVMWGDAIVIEVDDTLPRTSIPVWFDSEIFDDLNDHGDHDDHGDDDSEEMFPCDGGNTWISWDWVNDGYEDCEDGSDEYDDDDSEEMFLCDDGNEEIPMDWVNDGYEDCEDGSDEYDDDGDDDYEFYCSNDGEDYAESMGGILCPEGSGVTPECPNGESCVCIDVDGSCDDGDDDWGYYADDEDSHDDGSDNSGTDNGEDGHDDGDGPPSPEDVMHMTDSDGDGNMSQEEFVTYWNNENPDAPVDSDQSFLTTEDVEDLIELCDYDAPSDLIDINEMLCFIDNLVGMMPDDENTPSLDDFFNHFDTDGDGHLTATEFIDVNDVHDDDQDDVQAMFDMYDNDESGGLDYYEFEPLYDMMVDNDDGDHHETEEDAGHHHHGDGDYHHDHVDGSDGHTHDDADRHHDHDDDQSDDDSDGMERNEATGFVADNQTLNAPITDFEVHFLSDCEEEYDEEEDQMVQPDLSTCTNEFSIPLTGGEVEGVTITYTDHDGDGLVSPGDEVSVEWGEYDGEEIDKMEIYDTWASLYSSESSATPPVLPGFGTVLGAIALIGASIASRRD